MDSTANYFLAKNAIDSRILHTQFQNLSGVIPQQARSQPIFKGGS